jgi:Subtilase family
MCGPWGWFGIVLAGALVSAPAAAQLHVFGAMPTQHGRRVASSRLDGALAEISWRYAGVGTDHALASLHAINPAARFRLAAPLAVPEVLIDAVTTGDPLALRRALQDIGLRDVAVFSNDVGGWLPVDQIARAATLTELHFARASMPRTRAGPVATQGDFAQGTAAIRASFPGITGAGVTVGVLSDSFNCYQSYAANGVPASGPNGYASNGFSATYAQDQLSGALPAAVTVLKEASCLNYGAPEQLPFSDEGRALLQIVHAVAPGAKLAFYTADTSEADFANGIVKLAQGGARVIDDDVGYPDEPFFQDGLIAQAIDQVSTAGVAYFSSAGNDARTSYENLAPTFPVTSSTAPATGEQLLNFDTSGASTATTLPITIPSLFPGEFVVLGLQWDQPYVTGAANSGGATSSLDLCIIGATGTDQLDFGQTTGPCTGPNDLGVDPVQLLFVGNPADATASTPAVSFNISIGLANGTHAPGRVKFVVDGNGAAVSINAFATNSPTIQGHPNAAGAMAVGAAFYLQTPACGTTPAVLEDFSSAGGDPILFDAAGTRLATPLMRQKPQLIAPDGVNDTFLGFSVAQNSTIAGCGNNTSLPNFFGTSAAAPHAAAAAALMLQANPAVTAVQIDAALQTSALPMGGGLNDDSGYGFIQADAALALLPPAPPTLSVSPASVTIGASATLTWSSISTTSCSASGSWSGVQPTSGSRAITPASTGANTYTLTCSGAGGSNVSSALLTVSASSGGSKGGGGAFGEIDLLALCGLLLLSRRRLNGPGA